jgi:hypothetical protein
MMGWSNRRDSRTVQHWNICSKPSLFGKPIYQRSKKYYENLDKLKNGKDKGIQFREFL